MDGGDAAVANADGLMHHFHHRGQAIGGAAGRGDNLVLGGVVDMGVHTIDNIGRGPVFHRCADHHLFHPGIEIGLQRRLGFENARAVDHHIHPLQRQIGQMARADKGNARAIDANVAGIG